MSMSLYKKVKRTSQKRRYKGTIPQWSRKKVPYGHQEKGYQFFAASGLLWDATTANGTYVECVSLVGQGTGASQRIGLKSIHESLHIKLSIMPDSAATTEVYPDHGFWSIVLDRQPNQALATFSDMYNSSGMGVGYAMKRFQVNQQRFKVLCSEPWSLAGQGTSGTNASGPQPYWIDKWINLRKILGGPDMCQCFHGTGTTIVDVGSNALILVITQGNVSNVSTSAIRWRFLVKYGFTS